MREFLASLSEKDQEAFLLTEPFTVYTPPEYEEESEDDSVSL